MELPEDTKSWQIGVGFWFLTESSAGADSAFSGKGERTYSFGHKLDIFIKKSIRKDGLICIDFGSCENKELIERCIEAVSMCNSGKKRRRIIVRSDIDFHKFWAIIRSLTLNLFNLLLTFLIQNCFHIVLY